jgi:hypothetical protein
LGIGIGIGIGIGVGMGIKDVNAGSKVWNPIPSVTIESFIDFLLEL